jgi:hypothetical protein
MTELTTIKLSANNHLSAYTVVTEKSIYREYMEVAVFHSEL